MGLRRPPCPRRLKPIADDGTRAAATVVRLWGPTLNAAVHRKAAYSPLPSSPAFRTTPAPTPTPPRHQPNIPPHQPTSPLITNPQITASQDKSHQRSSPPLTTRQTRGKPKGIATSKRLIRNEQWGHCVVWADPPCDQTNLECSRSCI